MKFFVVSGPLRWVKTDNKGLTFINNKIYFIHN